MLQNIPKKTENHVFSLAGNDVISLLIGSLFSLPWTPIMHHLRERTRPCSLSVTGNGNGWATEPKDDHIRCENLGTIPYTRCIITGFFFLVSRFHLEKWVRSDDGYCWTDSQCQHLRFSNEERSKRNAHAAEKKREFFCSKMGDYAKLQPINYPRDTRSDLLGLMFVDQPEEGWQLIKLQDWSYFGHDPWL